MRNKEQNVLEAMMVLKEYCTGRDCPIDCILYTDKRKNDTRCMINQQNPCFYPVTTETKTMYVIKEE